MVGKKRKALVGLAEMLKHRIEHHGYVYDIHRQQDIIVQRIITELAKVGYDCAGKPCGCLGVLMDNIRAIAEEGEKGGE